MSCVLVSANPLFGEILRYTLLEAGSEEVVQVRPEAAKERIALEHPQLIVVDESRIGATELEEVLTLARSLPQSRTILLNLQNNDITIVSAERATIGKVEDMMKAIRVVEEKAHNGASERETVDDPAAAALARAGAYGFLALLCNQRPEVELVQRLRAMGNDGLLEMVDTDGGEAFLSKGLQEMADFVSQTAAQPDDAVQEMLAVDWTRLFRGVQTGYGPPPPYEGVYVEGDALGTMQAVARTYGEYGVAPAPGVAGNRPDYLGMELDFMRYVCEQQAAAFEEGDAEGIEKWSGAEEAFLRQHIGRWATVYCERAAEEAKTEFYGGVLHLIQGVVNGKHL